MSSPLYFAVLSSDTSTTPTPTPGTDISWPLYWCSTTLFGNHDDVIKRGHFPRYWPFVRGNHRSPVEENQPVTHHKGQWLRALCFLWSAPEQTVVQAIETPMIWDAIALIMRSFNVSCRRNLWGTEWFFFFLFIVMTFYIVPHCPKSVVIPIIDIWWVWDLYDVHVMLIRLHFSFKRLPASYRATKLNIMVVVFLGPYLKEID